MTTLCEDLVFAALLTLLVFAFLAYVRADVIRRRAEDALRQIVNRYCADYAHGNRDAGLAWAMASDACRRLGWPPPGETAEFWLTHGMMPTPFNVVWRVQDREDAARE